MLDAAPDLRLTYRFRWRAPGAAVLLPFQRRGWYAHGLGLTSSLTVDLVSAALELQLQLPFEAYSDARFTEWHDAFVAHLGPVLDASRFSVHIPAPYADMMIATSRRYDPHA